MADFTPSRQTVTVDGISLTKFNSTDTETSVPDNTKTTVHTQAFVSGTFENLVLVSVSGTTNAKWFITLNGSDIDVRRTSPGRNLQFDFSGAPYRLTVGDVVDVKVIHFNTGVLEDFDATIYGYEN